MYNFKVDVIAGDANSAACEYLRKHEYRDLYNSSVAVMLREIQREVDEGRPFEDRLYIDYYNSNHFVHISSASDLDCCFILSRMKAVRTQNDEDTSEQLA